ncbi:MAG: hypothetical protein CBC71_06375 [Rhodobacteraceae bacterium TMED111]|nr:hypothetical protein [Marinovum sp.]MAI17161.1 hypothetical protein [Marinovum sp.]OUV41070.1 MAG: hypothetical protein CBC71_06095 [Rhodobacteraceae bacterium TMED111]OUV41124.1 MAG: hypothetical protein CBC71_06375 [Rhodobacteraceae bacterium TMED111]|tara:strand:+ start:332 stop:523 length:192 start_codon:yes stop_codon:yes gene_type:complete
MINEFKELQRRTGTSNQGLAFLLDVNVHTVNNWKAGRAKIPPKVLSTLQTYADVAGDIFGRDD